MGFGSLDRHRRRQRGRRASCAIPSVTPWREIDLANGAFGQGIAVTPIQLAQAYSAMVNGGTLVRPRVVRSIGDAETQPVSRAG